MCGNICFDFFFSSCDHNIYILIVTRLPKYFVCTSVTVPLTLFRKKSLLTSEISEREKKQHLFEPKITSVLWNYFYFAVRFIVYISLKIFLLLLMHIIPKNMSVKLVSIILQSVISNDPCTKNEVFH